METSKSLFVIHEIPGKGRGVVATKNIMAGTLILAEDPLMTVPKPATEKTVLEKFKKLSPSEQIQFLDLHDSGNAEKSVWRIFRTNCMNVCGFAELGVEESAVYNSISRINHSCSPNAVWSCKNGNVRRQEVRACRNIEEGEEIQCSYVRVADFACKAQRKNRLLDRWDFVCACEVCSLTGSALEENEEIRAEIRKCDENLASLRSQTYKSNPGLIQDKQQLALTETQLKLDMMMDIEEESVLALPATLMQCYQLALITGRNPEWYQFKALELSRKLGDEFIKYCEDKIRTMKSR